MHWREWNFLTLYSPGGGGIRIEIFVQVLLIFNKKFVANIGEGVLDSNEIFLAWMV